MYPSRSLICISAVSFWLFTLAAQAQDQRQITIRVITTFDYPGTGNSTTPLHISSRGDVAGHYEDSLAVQRGFVRFKNGSFSPPIVEPNDTGNATTALSIDATGLICGYYSNVTSFHGFFLSGSTYTQYDVAGSLSTFVTDLNDAGDFCGSYDTTAGTRVGFLDVGGNVTTIDVNSVITNANGLNSTDQIVGEYHDAPPATTYHGYFRKSDGALTFPIDFPGATSTQLQDLNDRGLIVGNYVDSSGAVHGLIVKLPSTFISFDYPGSIGTSLNGINARGVISGRYSDSAGIRHGFLARTR